MCYISFPIVRLLNARNFLSLFSLGQCLDFRIIMYEWEFSYQKSILGHLEKRKRKEKVKKYSSNRTMCMNTEEFGC